VTVQLARRDLETPIVHAEDRGDRPEVIDPDVEVLDPFGDVGA